MKRNLLVIAALGAAIGFSVSGANAAPAGSMLETLKVSAGQSSVVEEARYRRRGYKKKSQNCWWGDRWLCRYLW